MIIETTVDRLEGAFAVLEVSGHMIDWPIAALPDGIIEGTRVSIALTALDSDTSEAEARLARLRSRSGTGDIDL